MQLLLAIDGMHLRDGGPPRVVAGSALALVRRGHQVTVLSTVSRAERTTVTRAWGELETAGIRLLLVDPCGAAALIGFGRLPQSVRDAIIAADYVHLHGIWSPFLLQVGKACRAVPRPYGVSVHGLLDRWSVEQSAFKKKIAIAAAGVPDYLDGADAVIFGTEGEARDACYLSANACRTVVPNGALLPNGPSIVTEAQRARLGAAVPSFSHWQRRILFFSRIHPKKGPDLLLEAFEDIAADYPGTGLLIAGIAQDAEYEAQLRKSAGRSSASSQIAVTTALTGEEGQFLYDACDIFALPSLQEGFSMAILEALAHKVPVLITHPCRLPEVELVGAGRCVAPDIPGLAAGLKSLLDLDEDQLQNAGQAARTLIADKYSWSGVAATLEQVYSGSRAHAL